MVRFTAQYLDNEKVYVVIDRVDHVLFRDPETAEAVEFELQDHAENFVNYLNDHPEPAAKFNRAMIEWFGHMDHCEGNCDE